MESTRAEDTLETLKWTKYTVCLHHIKICSSGVDLHFLLKVQSQPDVGRHFVLAGLLISGRGSG